MGLRGLETTRFQELGLLLEVSGVLGASFLFNEIQVVEISLSRGLLSIGVVLGDLAHQCGRNRQRRKSLRHALLATAPTAQGGLKNLIFVDDFCGSNNGQGSIKIFC